jgi:hypothetical protein
MTHLIQFYILEEKMHAKEAEMILDIQIQALHVLGMLFSRAL